MSNSPHRLLQPVAHPSPPRQGPPVAFIDAQGVEIGLQDTPQGRRILLTVITPVGVNRAQLTADAAVDLGKKLHMLGRGIIPGDGREHDPNIG